MADLTNPYWDTLQTSVHPATLTADVDSYGEIRDGTIAVKDGRIAWLDYRVDLPVNARATREHGSGGT